jgi:hypothetical protein
MVPCMALPKKPKTDKKFTKEGCRTNGMQFFQESSLGSRCTGRAVTTTQIPIYYPALILSLKLYQHYPDIS